MQRLFMSGASLIMMFCLALPLAARANVIYDVTVSYAAGVYIYSFSMEFDQIKDSYNRNDLVHGDFTNERFFSTSPSSSPDWALVDIPTTYLLFYPLNQAISFSTLDIFYADPKTSEYPRTKELADSYLIAEYAAQDLMFFRTDSISITKRPHTNVPEPATLALLGAGLLGLGVSRRRQFRKPASVQ